MKKSLVTPTVLKQKAKKLKKTKGISLHQALEEMAIQSGFSGYKHFLNDWESRQFPESSLNVQILLRKLSLEKDMSKKLDTAILFLQNNKMSFPEMFDIFNQFRDSKKHVQAACENSFLLDHVVRSMMLEYFRKSKLDIQALPLMNHFIVKNIGIESIECDLITERLNVSGLYAIEFEFEHEIEDHMRHMSHFNREPMFGEFEMTIDRNKQVTIANPTIGVVSDNGDHILTKFKLGNAYLDEVRLRRKREQAELIQSINSETEEDPN